MHRAALIKSVVPLSAIVGEVVKLRRSGNDLCGSCCFHEDSDPSLYVNDRKGLYHCFGCGVGGDIFSFIMQLEKIDFPEAFQRLENGFIPAAALRQSVPPATEVGDHVQYARRIWNNSGPVEGTPAEAYLASRSLPLDQLPDISMLRFDRLSYAGSQERYPALVAAVQDAAGEVVGIQRTYLKETGEKLDPHRAKRSLGSIKGNSIQIGESAPTMIICEGLEDGLSLSLWDDPLPVRVAAGAGLIRHIKLPGCTLRIIAGDNDDAGRAAATAAADHFRDRGMQATIIFPSPEFKDFNEQHHFAGFRDELRAWRGEESWA
jgi:DNA primase